MKQWISILIASCLLLSCGTADTPTADEPTTDTGTSLSKEQLNEAAATITDEKIYRGVVALSGDDMMGRDTGTEGEIKSSEWIAEEYRAMGLQPMGESTDYFQTVELVGYKKDPEESSLDLTGPDGTIPYTNGETFTYWSTAQKPALDVVGAPLLFVGYGVEAPEYNWDDFKGVDCTGKVLVFLNNDPQTGNPDEFGGEARTYYGRYTYKFEQAMRKGAAGAIMIHTTPSAGYGWSVIGTSGDRQSFALKLDGAGYQLDVLAWMHQDLAQQLAETVDSNLDAWFEAGNSRDFQPVELPVTLTATIKTEMTDTKARNVIGVWEGSDPDLKDEYVVFSAHYDHLGTTVDGEDHVYNGAWDNASGTSGIIEIARAFATHDIRPRRSIAFLACTAEEKGLLGSQWFAEKPPVPANQLAANINIDMPQIFGTTSDVVAIGHDANSLGEILRQVAAETEVVMPDGTVAEVQVKGDQNPNAGSFYRSDQVSFAKRGVPALYMLPGVTYVDGPTVDPKDYHAEHYHQKADELNTNWDLKGCARDMRIAFKVAALAADDPDLPRWNKGNEFEAAWMELHNP